MWPALLIIGGMIGLAIYLKDKKPSKQVWQVWWQKSLINEFNTEAGAILEKDRLVSEGASPENVDIKRIYK